MILDYLGVKVVEEKFLSSSPSFFPCLTVKALYFLIRKLRFATTSRPKCKNLEIPVFGLLTSLSNLFSF